MNYQPISLYKENPHYFWWRGKPTILITSAEHYASVFNRDFDYDKYLDTLESYGFNHTRTSTGIKRELPGSFNIDGNSQAPRVEAYVSPWQRTDIPGALDGGNKYDLSKWNEEYFDRWKDFLRKAGDHGIEVEIMLVSEFHVKFTGTAIWEACPLHPANSINSLPNVDPFDALSLKNTEGMKYFDALVTRLAKELNCFDNFHWEICNEPYYDLVPKDWMQHIVDLIIEIEESLPNKHLISQNINGCFYEFERNEPLDGVSIINFHQTVGANIRRNFWWPGALGLNETGILTDKKYWREAWDVIMNGAGLYNMLDYSFTCGHEDGSYEILPSNPGGGNHELRKRLCVLVRFINSFEFWKMDVAVDSVKAIWEPNTSFWALGEAGKQYAYYFITNHHTGQIPQMGVTVDIPSGKYSVRWLNAADGSVYSEYSVKHNGGRIRFESGQICPQIDKNLELETMLSIKRIEGKNECL